MIKETQNFLLYENYGPEFAPGSSPGTWTRCSIWYIIWNVCIFYEISWGVLMLVHYRGLPPTGWLRPIWYTCHEVNWNPPVWLGLSRKVVSMHLDLRVNAFGFTANTSVNASHAQNVLVQFFTVSSDDAYSSYPQNNFNKQGPQNRDKCSRHR